MTGVEQIRAALAASTQTSGPLAVVYCGAARAAYDRAVAELREIEIVLVARENALLASTPSLHQTTLPAGGA